MADCNRANLIPAREYLARRLVDVGSTTSFGVSGDYCAPWFDALGAEDRTGVWKEMTLVPCSQEQEAGYAAEGFAKASGAPGVVCATYGVGVFNILNATTSALVEGVPIVVLNGSPSEQDFLIQDNSAILYHHMIHGGRRRELNMFENITGASFIFGTPAEIPFQIDAAISCAINQRKPVYLEIPIEKWDSLVTPPSSPLALNKPFPTKIALDQATKAACLIHKGLSNAKQPIIWAGVEIERRGIQDKFLKFLAHYQIPFLTSHVGKGVVSEDTKNFAGVLCGGFSQSEITNRVQNSDYVLRLGVWTSDLDTAGNISEILNLHDGGYAFAQKDVVQGHDRKLFTEVPLELLFDEMLKLPAINKCALYDFKKCRGCVAEVVVDPKAQPTYDSFAAILGKSCLLRNAVLSVDATLALFSSLSVKVDRGQWFNELLWGSIGWTGGATNGIATGLPLSPNGLQKYKKVVTIIGDGGFQNCPFGLSTTARFAQELNLDITYVVFNNGLYSIDEFLVSVAGKPADNPYLNPQVPVPLFNTLADWSWSDLAVGMGVDRANTRVVSTNTALEEALQWANKTEGGCKLIEVKIPSRDLPAVCRGQLGSSSKL